MIHIKETEGGHGFASEVYFERTGKIRNRVQDCTREELIDLNYNYIALLEKTQGKLQKESEELEIELGWMTREE